MKLASVLNGRDNLFVIACNKCFKEFETVDEPDLRGIPEICCGAGKNRTQAVRNSIFCATRCTQKEN